MERARESEGFIDTDEAFYDHTPDHLYDEWEVMEGSMEDPGRMLGHFDIRTLHKVR